MVGFRDGLEQNLRWTIPESVNLAGKKKGKGRGLPNPNPKWYGGGTKGVAVQGKGSDTDV